MVYAQLLMCRLKRIKHCLLNMKSTDSNLYSEKPVYAFHDKYNVVDIGLTRINGVMRRLKKSFFRIPPGFSQIGGTAHQRCSHGGFVWIDRFVAKRLEKPTNVN